MLRYLLDTNLRMYVVKHRAPAAREIFNRHTAISSAMLSELIDGAETSAEPEQNLTVIESLPRASTSCRSTTAPPPTPVTSARTCSATTTRSGLTTS